MSQTTAVQSFDELKACFQAVGSRLSNDQLLELADLYHELLRERHVRSKTGG